MVSEAGQNEVGVHRLLRLLTLSHDCHSTQDVLLQLAAIAPGPATPSTSWRLPFFRRPPCGSFVAIVLVASPSWPTPCGILPRAFLLLIPFVDDKHERDRDRLSPRRESS